MRPVSLTRPALALITTVLLAAVVSTAQRPAPGAAAPPPGDADAIQIEQTLVKADDGVSTEGTLYWIPSRKPKATGVR